MKRRDCFADYARNDTAPLTMPLPLGERIKVRGFTPLDKAQPNRAAYLTGFTLIEMLTTTAILVIVFGLLAIIFGRATNIHKIVRSGGDAENLGVYLINTVTYGPGADRGKGLISAKPTLSAIAETDTLIFQGTDNQWIRYTLDGSSLKFNMSPDGSTWSYAPDVDLKPSWATDRLLEVITDPSLGYSEFLYYDTELNQTTIGVPCYVGIKLVLKNTLQNLEEAVTLYRCVRVRNQIDF